MNKDAKKVINVIIGIILFVLIFSFTICSLAKNVIKKDLITSIVKSELKLNESSKELQKLAENDEINKVIDGIIDDSINSIKTEKYEISAETFEDLKEYVKDNKEVFEDLAGEDVDIESIVDSDEFEDLKSELNKSFQELNQLSDKQKNAIKTFAKITSTAVILSLFIGIVALLLALFLINKSVLMPMLIGGIDLIVSGVLTSGMFICIKIVIGLIAKSADITISFSPSRILAVGLLELIIGIVLLVARGVLNKKTNKKIKNNVKKEEKEKEETSSKNKTKKTTKKK